MAGRLANWSLALPATFLVPTEAWLQRGGVKVLHTHLVGRPVSRLVVLPFGRSAKHFGRPSERNQAKRENCSQSLAACSSRYERTADRHFRPRVLRGTFAHLVWSKITRHQEVGMQMCAGKPAAHIWEAGNFNEFLANLGSGDALIVVSGSIFACSLNGLQLTTRWLQGD